jgi:signal peptidase I
MADDFTPPSHPQAPPAAGPPADGIRAALAQARQGDHPAPERPPGERSVVSLYLGYFAGLLIVLVCGWGALFAVFHFTRSTFKHADVILGVAALLDFGVFVLLEKDRWLSRLMGLRVTPHGGRWRSAFLFWLFGVVGVLFRSTVTPAAGDRRGQPVLLRGLTFRSTATPAEAEAAARKGEPPPPTDSTREIVETVVFVVVLVLMLKSFVAEAFVIPTGSMATTEYGYQKIVECPTCKVDFPVNCSQEVDPTEGLPTRVYACTCPNCRQQIHFPDAPRGWVMDHLNSVEVADPGWNSGDRVLVAKFVYDLTDRDPDRLDVVVFKFPGNPDFPRSGPQKNYVPMNYIKRLIGLPGETIAIYGGKLYRLGPDKGPHFDDAERARTDPELAANLWQLKYAHQNDAVLNELWEAGHFQIIRKRPDTILSMRRPVYDNDHPASDLPRSFDRWRGGQDSGWEATEKNGFRNAGGEGDVRWLRYRHLLRKDGGQPSLITDFSGYNSWEGGLHGGAPGENWASDLILECEVTVDRPEGEVVLEVAKASDLFRARFELASGSCTLARVRDADRGETQEEAIATRPTSLKGKGTYRVRLANVDDRLVVWVDNRLPFDDGVPYEPTQRFWPTAENDLNRPASVGVKGAAVRVEHLKLFRDTYYTACKGGSPSRSDVEVSWTDPGNWREEFKRRPVLTMYVQPGHFLCMGDNSPESSDGRSWGTVPRRLLLGRALLVYWPAGRAGRIR